MGVIYTLKAGLPGLVQRGSGRVLLISSMMAMYGESMMLIRFLMSSGNPFLTMVLPLLMRTTPRDPWLRLTSAVVVQLASVRQLT